MKMTLHLVKTKSIVQDSTSVLKICQTDNGVAKVPLFQPTLLSAYKVLTEIKTVIKIKKDLIQKAKVKKSYAKLKSREPPIDKPIPEADSETWKQQADIEEKAEEVTQELHPDRQAMLSRPRSPTPPPGSLRTSHYIPNPNASHASFPRPEKPNREPRNKKYAPKYFEKEVGIANKAKAEAAARKAEWEKNQAEKKARIEERERFRRQMAKARSGGRNGQRKLGRESVVLLERVKRLVGEK